MIRGLARNTRVAFRLLPVLLACALPVAVAADPVEAKPQKPAKHKRIAPSKRDLMKIPNSQIELIGWTEIAGWDADDHADAFAAFLASCRAILRSSKTTRDERPVLGALHDVCERAAAAIPLDDAGARKFYETNFRPARIAPLGDREGFFTGYYEPIVEGSRLPSDVYATPLYRRPSSLFVSRLRHAKGKGKFGKRTVKAKAGPSYDRTQIEEGALAGRGLEIVWLKDPIDAFFAQIQGSVRVRLEDGSVIRLNYDAQNGHPYTAVGRALVERGIYTREEISMQKIREWMAANPEEGKALRRTNKSYVFFRETNLSEHEDPPGAQGVALTAGRSIAVDRNIHTYGIPVFVDAVLPIQSEKPDTKFQRLMIAQDTGGAIIGPARADIYLGAGDEAARAAGRFKHNGRFVILIPLKLDPAKNTDDPPLPLPRPKIELSAARAGEKPASPAPATPTVTTASVFDRNVPLPRARPPIGRP
jgi:membrane-bound lytic murein transglycosylase A